jgi:archaellum component FlaD/FlaE
LTQSGAYLVANVSALDATFEDAGNYYYEVGYVQSNVYEQVLRYGKFIVI